MKVILKENVPNLGNKGDLKEVNRGYARNYLFPKGLAEEATPQKIKAWEKQKEIMEKKKQKEEEEARRMAQEMQGSTVRFNLKAGEDGKLFGSVTSADIADGLKKQGYQLDKRKIELDDPIKQVGSYEVEVKLGPGIVSTVHVEVERE